jgi:hypothetical protein
LVIGGRTRKFVGRAGDLRVRAAIVNTRVRSESAHAPVRDSRTEQ